MFQIRHAPVHARTIAGACQAGFGDRAACADLETRAGAGCRGGRPGLGLGGASHAVVHRLTQGLAIPPDRSAAEKRVAGCLDLLASTTGRVC